MTKFVIVMAIVAFVYFAEAVDPVDDPVKFVSDVMGFDVGKMVDEVSAANFQSAEGSGSVITNNKETVIENGVPVFQSIVNEASASNFQSADGSGRSVGSIITSNKETVIENGVPVEKIVTKYIINKDGNVYKGTL